MQLPLDGSGVDPRSGGSDDLDFPKFAVERPCAGRAADRCGRCLAAKIPILLKALLTRPVAFVLAGEMAVAYFQAHAPQSIFPVVNNGVPAVLYCFLFLYLSAAGAGAWSFDRLLRRTVWHAVTGPSLPETDEHRSGTRRIA